MTGFDPQISAILPSMREGYWVDIFTAKQELFRPHKGLFVQWYTVKVWQMDKQGSYGNREFLVLAIHEGGPGQPRMVIKQVLTEDRRTGKLVGLRAAEIDNWFGIWEDRQRNLAKSELIKAIEDKLTELEKPSK
jgi:hypothetical protein